MDTRETKSTQYQTVVQANDSIRVGGFTIPAGTNLVFLYSNGGNGSRNGNNGNDAARVPMNRDAERLDGPELSQIKSHGL